MELHDALARASQLMGEHGLLAQGWKLAIDNAVRRGGLCHYRKKTISLSRHFVTLNEWDGVDAVKNMVLHEIAHAKAPRGAGHGPQWKAIAQNIGCTGARCHAAMMPERQYTYACPNGHEVKRHRLISRRPLACSVCCKTYNRGKYTEAYLLTLKEETR